jgi:hypothetical protein
MAWNRLMVAGIAAASIALAAGCAGGSSTSPLAVGQQPTGSSDQITSRLQATSAPSERIADIERKAGVTRGTPQDPLANWVFVEPLAISDAGGNATISVPSFVTGCASIDPILGGLWYLSLSSFDLNFYQQQFPACTLPSTASVNVAKRDGVPVSGGGNVYIVQLDVGLISLSTTPVAGPALDGANDTFLIGSINPTLTFEPWHIYAYFLAEYTGTGTPATQSI